MGVNTRSVGVGVISVINLLLGPVGGGGSLVIDQSFHVVLVLLSINDDLLCLFQFLFEHLLCLLYFLCLLSDPHFKIKFLPFIGSRSQLVRLDHLLKKLFFSFFLHLNSILPHPQQFRVHLKLEILKMMMFLEILEGMSSKHLRSIARIGLALFS